MNKYQEAMKIVKSLNYASEGDKRNEWSTDDVDEAHKTLQELVDKATPKKSIELYDEYKDSYTNCCQKCELEVDENYCPNCGQALDWSNDE